MRTIKFGIIGCGLMGREFASAAARWSHLLNFSARPVIGGICDSNPDIFTWYQEACPELSQKTTDYKELLSNPDIDAIYCAVPHNLHRQIYIDIIESGKHLLSEKRFDTPGLRTGFLEPGRADKIVY